MIPGGLGAGPWPTGNVIYGAASGILEGPVVGFSTDEGQVQWVATPVALYAMRPGETTFHRFTSHDGLHLQDNPKYYCDDGGEFCHNPNNPGSADSRGIAEMTGGLAGEAYVGYWAVDETPDGHGGYLPPNLNDPGRFNGQIDRVKLNDDNTITVTRLQMVATHNMTWWHNRTIQRLVFDHFLHHNEVYVGTNHGVTRLVMDKWRRPLKSELGFNVSQAEWMADHLHPVTCRPSPGSPCNPDNTEAGGTQMMGEWRALGLDANGDIWVGGRWSAGKILWVQDPVAWAYRTGSKAFAPNRGLTDPPIFHVAQTADPSSISAVSVAPDGRVWWASGPWYNGPKDIAFGVAVTEAGGFHEVIYNSSQLGLPEQNVRDLVALPDGRILLAGWYAGLALYDPATGKSQQLRAPQWIPSDQVTRLEVDTMVTPWVVHVATRGGAASLRKLPQ